MKGGRYYLSKNTKEIIFWALDRLINDKKNDYVFVKQIEDIKKQLGSEDE